MTKEFFDLHLLLVKLHTTQQCKMHKQKNLCTTLRMYLHLVCKHQHHLYNNHGIKEYPELERKHHQVKLLALCRTTQNPNPTFESVVQTLLEFWQGCDIGVRLSSPRWHLQPRQTFIHTFACFQVPKPNIWSIGAFVWVKYKGTGFSCCSNQKPAFIPPSLRSPPSAWWQRARDPLYLTYPYQGWESMILPVCLLQFPVAPQISHLHLKLCLLSAWAVLPPGLRSHRCAHCC